MTQNEKKRLAIRQEVRRKKDPRVMINTTITELNNEKVRKI